MSTTYAKTSEGNSSNENKNARVSALSILDSNPEFVKTFIKSNRFFFETALLLTIMRDYNFWLEKCRDVLNVTDDINTWLQYKDFTKPIDNEIYSQIFNFYKTFPTVLDARGLVAGGENVKANRELILAMLADKVKSKQLSEQDFRIAEYRLNEIFASMPSTETDFEKSIKVVVDAGYGFWLEQQRIIQLTNYANKQKGSLDATTLMHLIERTISIVDDKLTEREDVGFESFEDSMNADLEETSGERMPISTLPLLTKALGGGVLRGETGLICATSGGGKTVFACQFAIGTAINGFKTLYITTEQPSTFLVPRMLSAHADIPFNKIKDGLKKAMKAGTLSEDEINKAREVNNMVNGFLQFANWCKSGDKLETSLEKLIKTKIKEWGGLDCIIVDWLGGGLNIPAEAYDKRYGYYMHCVNSMKDLAQKYNVFILVLAQASKQKVAGRVKLDVDCIDGCNTLDQPLTWAAGISSLQESGGAANKQKVNQIQESYLRKQCLNIWKGRMNGAYAYPIYREFEFQRFVEKETLELVAGQDMPTRIIDPKLLESGGFDNSMRQL